MTATNNDENQGRVEHVGHGDDRTVEFYLPLKDVPVELRDLKESWFSRMAVASRSEIREEWRKRWRHLKDDDLLALANMLINEYEPRSLALYKGRLWLVVERPITGKPRSRGCARLGDILLVPERRALTEETDKKVLAFLASQRNERNVQLLRAFIEDFSGLSVHIYPDTEAHIASIVESYEFFGRRPKGLDLPCLRVFTCISAYQVIVTRDGEVVWWHHDLEPEECIVPIAPDFREYLKLLIHHSDKVFGLNPWEWLWFPEEELTKPKVGEPRVELQADGRTGRANGK